MNEKESIVIDDGSRLLTNRQRLFVGYLNAILLYLTVINILDEYWSWVFIKSFTISMLVSVVLLFGLMFFLNAEKKAAAYFSKKPGTQAKILRGITSYILLVGGKFVLMGIIALLFGEAVQFSGPLHGAISFIGLVTAILVSDEIAKRIYTSLGSPVKD